MEALKQCGPIKKIKLLFTIVERGMGEEIVEILRESGVTFNMITPCHCAAGCNLMDYLGLTDAERDLILSVVQEDKVQAVMNKIIYKFDLDEPGNGVVFTVPISGVSGPLVLRYISGIQEEE